MGVEILGSDYTNDQTVTKMTRVDGDKAQKDEINVIKTFSGFEVADVPKGANGSLKVQDQRQEAALDNGVPKDVKDEWPAPNESHSFYLVKYRPYDDPQLKQKLDQAEKDLQKKNQARSQITDALRAKRSQKAEVIEILRPLNTEERAFRRTLDEKRKEMEPLQSALGKFRSANVASRERGQGLCSSEEELNRRIQSLQFRIEHDNNTLVEEKQMIREIKQLESTREKVIAHEAMQAKMQDSMGEKELFQDRFRLLGEGLDALRKEHQDMWNKIKPLEEDVRVINEEINSLQEELAVATQKRDKAFEAVQQFRKERDAANASYFQYRNVLNTAKDLASKRDKASLEEISQNEIEKFMSLWKGSKSFREDYEKRSAPYLVNRKLCTDGRMRNSDEKSPIPHGEAAIGSNFGRNNIKKETMLRKALNDDNTFAVSDGASKENHKHIIGATKGKLSSKATDINETEIAPEADVMHKDNSSTKDEVDSVLLKEKRREEEIAKARLAQERKKRQAEKAQAKAAAKAQKETEKKLKEREKKAKKKAAAGQVSTPEPEPNTEEAADGAAEPELKITEDTDPQKGTGTSDNLRQRKRDFTSKSKGKAAFPKSALKKKQFFPTWLWAGVATLLVFVLLVIGYYYAL